VLILVLPPAPMASTDTNDPKSAGTVNVVPEVMNTVLTAMADPCLSYLLALTMNYNSQQKSTRRCFFASSHP
jgi:hypothetical protein